MFLGAVRLLCREAQFGSLALSQAAALYYFIVIPFNRFAAKFMASPSGPTPTDTLLGEIRDALKGKA